MYIDKKLNEFKKIIEKEKEKQNNNDEKHEQMEDDIEMENIVRSGKQPILQQPTVISNMGRLSSLSRFLIEKAISHVRKRYPILNTIISVKMITQLGMFIILFLYFFYYNYITIISRYYYIIVFSGMFCYINFFDILSGFFMHYIRSCHTQFKIGQMKSSEARKIQYIWMRCCITTFPTIHPIPQDYVSICKANVLNKEAFKELITPADFQELPDIHEYLLNVKDLINKCGGIGNFFKAMHNLWASKDDIKVYYGIQHAFRKTIVVCYIFITISLQ